MNEWTAPDERCWAHLSAAQTTAGVWGALWAPPAGFGGGAPTAQRFSTIFSTQDGLSWHYNIVDYHAAIGGKTPCPHLVYAPESYSPGADDATSAMGNPPLFRNAAVTPATATAQLPCAFRAIAIPIRGCTVAIKVESQSRRSCNRRTAAATDSSERKATRSVRHVPRISRTRRTTSECWRRWEPAATSARCPRGRSARVCPSCSPVVTVA